MRIIVKIIEQTGKFIETKGGISTEETITKTGTIDRDSI